MNSERAQIIALQALGWLAAHDELSAVFMGASGTSVDDMRMRAVDPAFQASVLEFLTMDDAWVIEFCDAHDCKYEEPLKARYALPGADMTGLADFQ